VALSFPGEARARVEIIANLLANKLGGKEHVFYDNWYKGDLARFNLQPYLQDIYCKQTLLRVFLARGKRVDKRADIWSWGVVLYELLTGERLFKGDEAADTLAQVLTKEPDWDRAPVRVQRLLQRCLEKDTKQRLRGIGDARLLLRDAQEVTATPPLQVWRRPVVLWSLLGAVVLIAAALGAGMWRATRPTDRPLMWLSVDLGPDARASRDFTAAISPDGTRLVFPIGDPGASRLAVRSLGQPNATPLAGTEGGANPTQPLLQHLQKLPAPPPHLVRPTLHAEQVCVVTATFQYAEMFGLIRRKNTAGILIRGTLGLHLSYA
jgi:hypothetical protein